MNSTAADEYCTQGGLSNEPLWARCLDRLTSRSPHGEEHIMTRHRLVPIQRHRDERGSLIVLDDSTDADFTVRRTYIISHVPAGETRGGHAHRNLHQVILPILGSVTVAVDDGEKEQTYHLDDPTQGLFIGRMVWRELRDFTPDAVVLVGASLPYDPDDYISSRHRFYDEYAAETAIIPVL